VAEDNVDSLPHFNIESLTKWTATCLVALYSGGFLTTSIYYGRFGFRDLSPLKASVLAAGVWLMVTLGWPVYCAYLTLRIGSSSATGIAVRAEQWLSLYWICRLSAFFAGGTLLSLDPSTPWNFWWKPWWTKSMVVLMAAIISMAVVAAAAVSRKATTSRLLAIVSLITFTPVVVYSWPASGTLSLDGLTLILFGYGLGYMVIARDFRRTLPTSPQRFWLFCSSTVIAAITVFATIIYPHIQAAWGGGAPISVVLYMSKDSRLMPNGQLGAKLVDESESGYYVLSSGRQDAIFVPRTAVSTVVYSDKPLDPVLFQQISPETSPAPAGK
jgi:hypothetical protein